MPEDDVPKEFYDVVDEFVHLANKLNEKWPPWRISSAIMYAAARYNAFNFHTQDANASQNVEKATDYFCAQYKAMLLENIKALGRPQDAPPNGGPPKLPGDSGTGGGPPSVS
jgi:hypothetical protein